ncbi:peptidase u61 ld-carboxypeptidase a [Podospora didyma]|uniref:Peptidase u61 ld-carboxypeptidase a n=1 Tax=Podospora didyma TaxID=330526 RepID=A0AAE0P0Z5_9PEZI|nr:peptidase u61 ld-carboxypeptidase a [Podospora didyma]
METPALKPKALKKGDKIAIVSPSARLNVEFHAAISRAKSVLETHGTLKSTVEIFWTDSDPKTTTINHSVRHRVAELVAAFTDPDVRAIICTIGGSTANELTRLLLTNETLAASIVQDPKIFVRMSDITILHWVLAKHGLRTFYGPAALDDLGEASDPSDEEQPLHFSLENLIRAICDRPDKAPIDQVARSRNFATHLPDFWNGNPSSTLPRILSLTPPWTWLRSGKARGNIFGGLLHAVVRLHGVPELVPDWAGKILFVETATMDGNDEKGTPLSRVQQHLVDLTAYGVFDKIAGLIVGRPIGYNTPAELEAYGEVVTNVVVHGGLHSNPVEFPILFNVDIGHAAPMVTIPMFAEVALDSAENRFEIIEPGVKFSGDD